MRGQKGKPASTREVVCGDKQAEPENSSSKVPPQIDSPPFPVPVGSPPCIINPFIFRWNKVPSYWPAAHNAMKLKADFGTTSHAISILMSVSFRLMAISNVPSLQATSRLTTKGRQECDAHEEQARGGDNSIYC